jgi:hypothetical protein
VRLAITSTQIHKLKKTGKKHKETYSFSKWVVPEKIHTPPKEEISAVRRGRGEKIVSDNSKCIGTSEGGRGVNFLFPLWGWYGCFLE